ncbi:MAG: hypothetical protein OR994_02270 [Candidatus Poseidoniales archaeon]|nr:hypothetical protein [Candidatus Poseidoniales archaeon]
MAESPFTQYAGQTTVLGAKKDPQGNAEGTQYDLAKDGSFDGHTILVLHLYTGEGFDFAKPTAALVEKGFNVIRHTKPPPANQLRTELLAASQVWIISSQVRQLSEEHLNIIDDFFQQGKGVYIWGDNDPYYVDANAVASKLLGCSMSGNSRGDKVVNEAMSNGQNGFIKHQITTGLEFLYEGITIAQINYPEEQLIPILRGSDGHVVTACYDSDGKRAILDGGFTRLFLQWDDAGTARFVKNAAAWLVNWERFNNSPNVAKNLQAQRSTSPLKQHSTPPMKKQTPVKPKDSTQKPTLRSQGSRWQE